MTPAGTGNASDQKAEKIDRRLSVAPMMERTDRHFRYFLRLLAPRTLLYTEMVTAAAVVHGDAERLLRFDPAEHPVALQLGGSEPELLASAARAGAERGYDEINLNIGCPSARVQSGRFGVCLMREPVLVAECVTAMREAVQVPVTVKTRIGVDDEDGFEFLAQFVETVAAARCRTFIVHARKAWLHGMSPKDNRTLPPLNHGRVAELKRAFPALEVIVNGGISTAAQTRDQLECMDGVMIGREAYRNPWLMAQLDRMVWTEPAGAPSRAQVVAAYLPYAARELELGERLHHLTRHLLGLYHGEPGAATWRRELGPKRSCGDGGTEVLTRALETMRESQGFGASGGGSRPKSLPAAAAM